MSERMGEQPGRIRMEVDLTPQQAYELLDAARDLGVSPQQVAVYGILVAVQLAKEQGQSPEPSALAVVRDPGAVAKRCPESIVFLESPRRIADRGTI